MFNVGPLELIVVLIIALIVLGPQRLPEVARSVGRGMREFRSALDSERDDDEEQDEYEPVEPARPGTLEAGAPKPAGDAGTAEPASAEPPAPEPPKP